MSANMSKSDRSVAGSGPLYPHTPAGLAAAEEPVHIPRSDDDSDPSDGSPELDEVDHPTGERQASENRDNEPPV
jgi:hypothetical protein